MAPRNHPLPDGEFLTINVTGCLNSSRSMGTAFPHQQRLAKSDILTVTRTLFRSCSMAPLNWSDTITINCNSVLLTVNGGSGRQLSRSTATRPPGSFNGGANSDSFTVNGNSSILTRERRRL